MERRRCQQCAIPLAQDNRGTRCSACQMKRSVDDSAPGPPAALWDRPEVKAAIDARHIGRLFRAYRQAHNPTIPQETLARWVQLTQGQISIIERTRRPVNDLERLERWCEALHMPDRLRWFCGPARPEAGPLRESNRSDGHTGGRELTRPDVLYPDDEHAQDDVNRRELLRLISLAGSLITVPLSLSDIDFDRMEYAAQHPGRLDSATLDNYATINRDLWRAYSNASAKNCVMPAVREHLTAVVASLEKPLDSSVRDRLNKLASDIFQLCGEIMFDSNRYADAAHCYALATNACKEANAFDLWACAMTRHAFIGIYEERHRNARVLLSGAQRLADKGDPQLSTRHWVAAVQAQAHAGLGEFDACQRALDRAEQVGRLTAPTPTSGGWLRFEGSRLDEERGACYVQLRRPHLAEPVLTKALRQPISIRRRGSVLTDLAHAGAQRGDVDQVLMYGAAALDTMRQTGSAGFLGRKLSALPSQLAAHLGDSHVQYLVTQIENTAAATAVAST